jgi:hypothetical protein
MSKLDELAEQLRERRRECESLILKIEGLNRQEIEIQDALIKARQEHAEAMAQMWKTSESLYNYATTGDVATKPPGLNLP